MLRFTLKDLLLGILVVALVLGWWLDRRSLAKLAKRNEQAFDAAVDELQMFYKCTVKLTDDPGGVSFIGQDGIERWVKVPHRDWPESN